MISEFHQKRCKKKLRYLNINLLRALQEMMAAPEGLEPPTLGFEDRYSIQLNYRATANGEFSLILLVTIELLQRGRGALRAFGV